VKITINVYDSNETNFDKNGLMVLSDSMSALITEELNGQFELTLEYPLDLREKWHNLIEDNIIKADGQLFRIYRKVKTLTSIVVNARHIFYDLLDNFLEDVKVINTTGYGALSSVLSNTQYTHTFSNIGDVGGSETNEFIKINPVEAIMGTTGIINTWGGELVRDNFNIKILGARGLDRGVLVAYGKNIQGIEETLDIDGLCTRLMPIGKDGLLLAEKYIDSPYINNYAHPKIKSVQFDNCEDEVTLRVSGQQYILDSKCDIPQFNYKIDFLELSKTEEYKNYAVLERVYMGDTVTIKHSKLNINLKAKVIKVTKNSLTSRIEKIELGSFKPNIATAINNAIQAVKKDIVQVKTDYQKAIDNATNLITGSNGGNVVIRQGEDKKPYEILIMDTTDVMTAVKVWRWNLGGFGYSSTGINGPFSTAITMDGSIVGSFIAANSIDASKIKTDELVVGDNILVGPNATIGYEKITNKPTLIDSNTVTTISRNEIATATIKVNQLLIGGENGSISFLNLIDKPTIPTTAGEVGALPVGTFIPGDTYITTITEDTIKTTNVVATNLQVSSANITGPLVADSIDAWGEVNIHTNATIGKQLILENLDMSDTLINLAPYRLPGSVCSIGAVMGNSGEFHIVLDSTYGFDFIVGAYGSVNLPANTYVGNTLLSGTAKFA